MYFGALLILFFHSAMNIRGQDEGLSREQEMVHLGWLHLVLTSPGFCLDLLSVIPHLCSREDLSARSLAAHIETNQQLPVDETYLASSWEYLCHYLAGQCVATTLGPWLMGFMFAFLLLSRSTTDKWHPFLCAACMAASSQLVYGSKHLGILIYFDLWSSQLDSYGLTVRFFFSAFCWE